MEQTFFETWKSAYVYLQTNQPNPDFIVMDSLLNGSSSAEYIPDLLSIAWLTRPTIVIYSSMQPISHMAALMKANDFPFLSKNGSIEKLGQDIDKMIHSIEK